MSVLYWKAVLADTLRHVRVAMLAESRSHRMDGRRKVGSTTGSAGPPGK
jgi:hypothetical protein